MFNIAQDHQVNTDVLDKIPDKCSISQSPFLREEFTSSIAKYNNSSASGPDKLSWSYLKTIIKDNSCLDKIMNIADTCFELGFWPSHFKTSSMIIIPKPNKKSYDSPKSFRSIILLNILGKLIEKVIGKNLQFYLILNNFIHLCQLGGLKQRSTIDVGITLSYFICSGWVKNNTMNTLAFDIAQFFPSLNHYFLPLILKKARCDSKVYHFFQNYLVGRKMQYCQNNFSSQFFNIDVGVEQDLALSPILSALYITPVFHILEKCLKNLKNLVSILLFIDDGLFVAQSKSLTTSNSFLFCSYNIVSPLLKKFGLILEHGKMEVFHFSRPHRTFNPPPLNLSALGGPSLRPRDTQKYLGFIFDRKLLFQQYIDYYANKALLTVKCMKILRNSTCGLIPNQKCLLYRSYILSICHMLSPFIQKTHLHGTFLANN